jgi:hypothetical protein
MSWIKTYTGKQFWPLDPKPEDVDIRDIAHALSLICRFTGHVKQHMSVAQHCLIVSSLLPPHLKIYGLLHDAGEAYMADVARPIKSAFPKFREFEHRILEEAVWKAFALEPLSKEDAARVRHADDVVLATEARDLMGGTANWSALPDPLPSEIIPMQCGDAEEPFLREFERLMWRRALREDCNVS